MKSVILTLLDFVFVVLVILLGILLIYILNTNQVPLQSWMDKAQTLVQNLPPITIPEPGGVVTGVVTTEIPDFFHIEKKNLVDTLPLPSQEPTATPVPDPVYYRNEVILRTKNFANAMESFFEVNEKLRTDPNLLRDEQWRKDIHSRLDLLAAAAVELGEVEPAPAEYASIQAALQSVSPHALKLRDDYMLGIETESQDAMKAASDELNQIYVAMTQVQTEMVKAGWQP